MKFIPYLCDVMQELRPNQKWQVIDNGPSKQELIYDSENSLPIPTEDELLEESGKTEDKLNWKVLRQTRDNRLAETDWMANSDVTMSDAWKTYRQTLRDLPANTSDPINPTWPTKPS
tara:strand:- start:42 stop:392 length:351 start_codon:yes stop_codon:yes gene_type:complete